MPHSVCRFAIVGAQAGRPVPFPHMDGERGRISLVLCCLYRVVIYSTLLLQFCSIFGCQLRQQLWLSLQRVHKHPQ